MRSVLWHFMNAPSATEDKSDIPKDRPFEDVDHIRKYNTKFIFGDFILKLWTQYICKPNLGATVYVNTVPVMAMVSRVMNFSRSQNVIFNSYMFPQINIHAYVTDISWCVGSYRVDQILIFYKVQRKMFCPTGGSNRRVGKNA